MRRDLLIQHLQSCLTQKLNAPDLRVVALSRPAQDKRREPWIDIKYGAGGPDDWYGVVPATVRLERAPGLAAESLDLVIKVMPRQSLARTLIPWIVAQRKIALDRPYWGYRSAAEMDDTRDREAQVYALAQSEPALRQWLPRYYGSVVDAESGQRALFLELVSGAKRLDPSGATADWPPELIDTALTAAAQWHALFWNAAPSFAARRMTTADMIADAPLWRGLLDDARQRFPDIVTESAWRRRHDIIDRLSDWHRIKDALPATLAHNDFNQRNIGFRPAVLVLDWELVQLNTAHRDSVELLTFVLPAAADRAQVDARLEAHRQGLIASGVTSGVDRDAWVEGFRCELRVEAINRVGLQLLFGAQYPLAYLARINGAIERLLDLYA